MSISFFLSTQITTTKIAAATTATMHEKQLEGFPLNSERSDFVRMIKNI